MQTGKSTQNQNMLTRHKFIELAGKSALALGFGGAMSLVTGGCFANNNNGGNATGQQSGSAATASVTGSADEVVISMPKTCEPSAGFDPFVSWGCGEHVHEPLIQSTLITTNASMGFENDLATSYTCSSDGLTWTFNIRSDAYFSNGNKLTARDVAYTINGIKAYEASECDLTYVESAQATNDTTCVVKLKKPFNAFLYTLAVVGIVPDGAHDVNYGTNPIGSGRYMLEQWEVGQQVILKANPNYYGAAPTIKRVVVVFMDEAPSLAAAQAKQVDVAYTSCTYANQTVQGYVLNSYSSVDSRGVSLPTESAGKTKTYRGKTYACGNNVTSDVALRRAINYATNRTQLINHVLEGYGSAAYSVAEGMPWASADMQCEVNAGAAKKLLEDAGWKLNSSSSIREKDGVKASFTLYYAATDSVRQAMAEEFANQMQEVGIEVNPKGTSWDEIYEHEFSDPVLWGWGTNSPVETYNILYSGGVCNYSNYSNETVDAHLNDALAKTSVEDSYDDYKLAMWDGTEGVSPAGAATWVWFANVAHLYFVANGLNVSQQKPHPHGHGWSLLNNVDTWHW